MHSEVTLELTRTEAEIALGAVNQLLQKQQRAGFTPGDEHHRTTVRTFAKMRWAIRDSDPNCM